MSLSSVFREWKKYEFTPNFAPGGAATVPPMVVITAFVATLTKNDSGVSVYSEADWRRVLADEGIDDPDDVANALETIGTWDGHPGLD